MRFAVLVVLALGCGHGKGGGIAVTGSTPLVELSDAQVMDLCEQAVEVFGEQPRTVDCGNGQTFTVMLSLQDCIANVGTFVESCEATVDDELACVEDSAELTDEQLCNSEQPRSCEPLIGCSGF